MAHQEMVVAWLNDAHAMENSLVQTLQQHAKDAKDFPQVQARLEQHIEETRRHAELVKGCVERLGSSTSSVKSGMATVMGTVQGMTTDMAGMAKDSLVKNALADYGAEQFEVGSYRALIAGAQAIGDQETARVCQEILREDEAMAMWLDQQLPQLVQTTIQQQAASHSG